MSGVRIDLLDTLIVNDMRRVIRVDGGRYQFHLCSGKTAGVVSNSPKPPSLSPSQPTRQTHNKR